MKSVAAVTLVLFIAGCPANTPLPPDPCFSFVRDFGGTSRETRRVFFEELRLSGVSKLDAIVAAEAACRDTCVLEECRVACTDCNASVIDGVYGG